MNKFVNCLGSPWTQRQYRKADKRINRIYKGLYKHADKKVIWAANTGYTSCGFQSNL